MAMLTEFLEIAVEDRLSKWQLPDPSAPWLQISWVPI